MIRPRDTSDFPALVQAIRAVHEQDAYPTVWPADPAAFLDPPLTLAAWTALKDDGEVVGQAILRAVPLDSIPAWVQATGLPARDVAVISRLFISPAGRGLGLAQTLFHAAWAEAQRLHKHAILDVHQKNTAAIALYDRAGWQRVATVNGDWLDPDGSVPRVHVYVAPT